MIVIFPTVVLVLLVAFCGLFSEVSEDYRVWNEVGKLEDNRTRWAWPS